MKINTIDLLGLLFIGLKLGQIIDWSWWWVLSPFWIPLTVLVAFWIIALAMGVTVGIASGIDEIFKAITKKK